MVLPNVKEQILEDLDRLPPERQRQAADYVHRLASRPIQGTPGHEFMRFAGILDDQSAREMMEAIEEGCGRVDLDEW